MSLMPLRVFTHAEKMIVSALSNIDASSFDHCVVGAGPVGITLALELAARGQRVLVLESGGEKSTPQAQNLSEAQLVDPNAHDDMRIAVARRLGGTSNLWGGRCTPYDPIDFENRPGTLGPSWPIELEDIAPHYSTACRYANCGEPVFEAPIKGVSVKDGRFTHNTIERWSHKPKFQQAHRATLIAHPNVTVCLHATVVDLEFARGDRNRVCAVIVADADGRRIGLVVKNLILAAGGVETTRLLLHVQQRSPWALGGIGGPLGRYYMGHVIGQIADVTFSNETIDAAMDFFLDGQGSYVRRRFVPSHQLQLEQCLTNVALWPVVPPSADARHGSGPLSLAALLMSCGPVARMLVAEAIRKRHVVDGMPRLPHLKNVLMDLPRTAACVASAFVRRYISEVRHSAFYVRNREMRYGLSYHAEHLPNPDSRVRLTDDVDRLGLPRVSIDLRFSPQDIKAVVRTHELFADWLRSTSLGRVEFRQPPHDNYAAVAAQARHGTHQIGLVRMAENSKDGVVDANLRCFDFENLYVAGPAVLPTSGQAAPTLTAIALAIRLAHHLTAPAEKAPRSTSSEWKSARKTNVKAAPI